MTIALIVDYSGYPVKAFRSEETARIELNRMNGALSPWEQLAGYFYRLLHSIDFDEG